MTDKPKQSIPWVQYILGGLILFGLSTLTTFVIANWDTVNSLIYESSLAKYETMTGERGPTTYLISHTDFDALQAMADKHEGILGVEQALDSNVAKMAFISAKSPLIEEVGKLASVTAMINRNVPMICH